MVLIFEGDSPENVPESTKRLFKTFPFYHGAAREFLFKGNKEVGPKGLLYVGQCEFAVVTSQDNNVSVIGSDDATTCIIAILRHSASGATALAHFDGTDMEDVINTMIKQIEELSVGCEGRIDLQFVGGYSDERSYSEQIFYDAVRIFHSHSTTVNLTLACIGDLNTVVSGGVPWPIMYGAGVDLKTGEVFPATFSEKGPEADLRHARLYSSTSFAEIYDNKGGIFKIDPFSYTFTDNLDFLLKQDDKFLLANSSTSPLVEPPGYVQQTRRAMQFMKDHPDPLLTVFKKNQPHYFKRNEDCTSWIPIVI